MALALDEHIPVVELVVAVLCVVEFVSGFCVAIPVPLAAVGGFCILYGSASSSGGSWVWQAAAQSNCDFVTDIGILCVVFSAVIIGVEIAIIARYTWIVSKLNVVSLVVTPLEALLALLTLIAACVLTEGFSTWCGAITDAFTQAYNSTLTCKQIQNLENWTVVDGGKLVVVNPKFYDQLTTAQVAVWLCCIVWVVILIIGIYNLCRTGGLPCGSS